MDYLTLLIYQQNEKKFYLRLEFHPLLLFNLNKDQIMRWYAV